MQLVFNYNRVENNPASTKILRDNVKHFSRQCIVLKEAFERGEVLTVFDIMTKYFIGDPRARIRDLRDAGVPVKDELIEKRFKKYYL
jgi:hypothetical protein